MDLDGHRAGMSAVFEESSGGDVPPFEGWRAIFGVITSRLCALPHNLCTLCHLGEKSPSPPPGASVRGSNDAGEEEVATSGEVSLSSRRYASAHVRLCELTHINGNLCP